MEQRDYLTKEKAHYEHTTPELAIGNVDWHERYPYENFLLRYKRKGFEDKIALDFGCGPGRMIARMSKIFKRVDGVDISSNLLATAKEKCPDSNLFLTEGNDLGTAPSETYDLVYSTICMQHIASRTIRNSIVQNMHRVLKPGGEIAIQMAYHPSPVIPHNARWNEDKYDTDRFNGGCDVEINDSDLEDVKKDFGLYFEHITLDFSNIKEYGHPDYWASHWIYIYGKKAGGPEGEDITFTFGIITAGGMDERINLIIDSIEKEQIPEYEIIVIGSCGVVRNKTRIIPFDEGQRPGWITRKKNLITAHAVYENVVYMHDYVSLYPGWYRGMKSYGNEFKILLTKMLNPNETRFSEWLLDPHTSQSALPGKPWMECLMPYDIRHLSRMMYISGAYWIAKKEVMLKYPLDENRSWNQEEDLYWSRAVRDVHQFELNIESSVILLKDHRMLWYDTSEETNRKLRALP